MAVEGFAQRQDLGLLEGVGHPVAPQEAVGRGGPRGGDH